MQSIQLDSLVKIFSLYKQLGLEPLYDKRQSDPNLDENDAIEKEEEDQIDTKMVGAVDLVSSNAKVKIIRKLF